VPYSQVRAVFPVRPCARERLVDLSAPRQVFGFLPLPTKLAEWFPVPSSPSLALQRGLTWTFYLSALLAFLESAFLVVGLKSRSSLPASKGEEEKVPLGRAVVAAVKELPMGFVIAAKEGEIALAYLASFAVSRSFFGSRSCFR
jgi:hypothetical protein